MEEERDRGKDVRREKNKNWREKLERKDKKLRGKKSTRYGEKVGKERKQVRKVMEDEEEEGRKGERRK